jgi:hypothetical protein
LANFHRAAARFRWHPLQQPRRKIRALANAGRVQRLADCRILPR